jgi:hypothetical protein
MHTYVLVAMPTVHAALHNPAGATAAWPCVYSVQQVSLQHMRVQLCLHMVFLQALVRWGGALLELAHFKQGSDADKCISDVSACS